ncbi:MAG: YhcB family protein [Anaerolineae bacterium]|nr:YhcB family protein [Anaerolineae bacterium]
MIEVIIALVVGVALGAWGYRYMLKRDPDAIERLAAQARQLGDRF